MLKLKLVMIMKPLIKFLYSKQEKLLNILKSLSMMTIIGNQMKTFSYNYMTPMKKEVSQSLKVRTHELE